ncbi:hypothetical protein CPAV1605_841 [seawater metagenome]|uniref:DUF676 domain-containing protein n=1 Tax=seawater metagenome TaxID=1561972 RepID=A0A5E8CJ14_9ZZZZ
MYFFFKIYVVINLISFFIMTRTPILFWKQQKKDEYEYFFKNYIQTFFNFIIPRIPFCNIGVINKSQIFYKNQNSEEEWYFINGICNSIELSKRSQNSLEEIFNRKINLVYNETRSFITDLFEASIQLLINIDTPLIKKFANDVHSNIKKNKKIIIIAHSEGSIISNSMINYLKRTYPNTDFNKIELYYFANFGIHRNKFKKNNKPYIEIICNKKDTLSLLFSTQLNNKLNIDKYIILNNGYHWCCYDYFSHISSQRGLLDSKLIKYISIE